MTLFELVKIALDELYSQGKKQHKGKLDDEIKAQLKYLSSSFGELDLAERKPISYRDPATRFAYVYKYVASHGDYIVQVLEYCGKNSGETSLTPQIRAFPALEGVPVATSSPS